MASKLGPRIVTDNLVLAVDCADAKSYAGDPVTNMAYNLGIGGHGSTWEAISEVPSSIGQTGPGANIDFKKLHDDSIANTFSGANGKIFRNYVNNPATSDNTSFNNNGGFRYASAIGLTSGGDSGYVIISFWCYLVTGYQGYGGNGLSSAYMRFQNSGGYTGNGSKSFYVDGVSKTTNETFNGDTGRWKFVQIRFSKPTGSTAIQNFYIYADRNTQGEMYICQLQIEDRSDGTFHQVPFVEGVSSRSATDGWVDLSGNSNDGTLVNGVVTGTSHYRVGDVIYPAGTNHARYLDFDNTDDYVDFGTISSTGYSSFTIDTWIWLPIDSRGGGTILNYGNNKLRIVINYAGDLSYFIIAGLFSIGTLPTYPPDGGVTRINGWLNIVFTFDNNSKTFKLMRVTQQYGIETIFSSAGSLFDFTGSTDFILGAESSSSGFLDGRIGSCKIYDKALSTAEITQNYNSAKYKFGLPVIWTEFNQ